MRGMGCGRLRSGCCMLEAEGYLGNTETRLRKLRLIVDGWWGLG
jgi:hypothetical protein